MAENEAEGAGSRSLHFSASGELREQTTLFQALTRLCFLLRDQRPRLPFPPALGDPAAADRLHPWWFRKSQINSLPIMELIFIEGSLCAGRCVKCLASCRTPNTSMAWVPGSPALKKGESRAQRA